MKVKHLKYEIDESADRFAYFENFWKRVGLELLLEHSSKGAAEGEVSLLDYGCGRGEMLKLAGAAGLAVTGCDPDPTCVKMASEFGEAKLVPPGDPLQHFERKSFDAVSCFHVLEHTESPIEVLRGLGEIAREYVVLAVPNLRNLRLIFRRHIDLAEVNEGHLQSWDHWHLRNLAERHCGLELVEWGFDCTQLPVLSQVIAKTLGQKAVTAVETGLFRKMFPFHGHSVIGLFRPAREGSQITR